MTHIGSTESGASVYCAIKGPPIINLSRISAMSHIGRRLRGFETTYTNRSREQFRDKDALKLINAGAVDYLNVKLVSCPGSK